MDNTAIPTLIEALKQASSLWSEEITVERNEFIIREGVVENHIYWVESGAIRAFRVTEHEEQTIRFGYQQSLITSISSFYSGKPSDLYLQALRKSVLRKATKADFDAFIAESKERLMQYQQLLETVLLQQVARETDLLTHSPIERYQRVLARSPQLFQEIPAKYIASYLRMTPETLSRIRKD